MNNIDNRPLNFGKHKGNTPSSLLDTDPSYIIWMYDNINPPPCSKSLYDFAKQELEDADLLSELACYYHAENFGDRD